ncbi:hypothetical protein TVAG_349770 [Trichomonas vaginalis G3]|uniref:Spt20-like SEP domain-containing protein n=1 Tax=Trichomonas vaginalis (strain ATCC PRA-98 / G3) TaxID=412133 RepID=A2FYB5_TRIV3|nr:Spt20 family [Trichomonas vaginalis G3]EAX90099.1 hypothetical protein TVAG_349770 [Trichomonas vaginalis G3]KAI5534297.1 Spt20 family [Trichomonas vaginalis G3]|eukprot:XP_001303029.1 hypothetical protein [Trichomonas vaginalis G3]
MSSWQRVGFMNGNASHKTNESKAEQMMSTDIYEKVFKSSFEIVRQNLDNGSYKNLDVQPYIDRLTFFLESLPDNDFKSFNILTPNFDTYQERASIIIKFWPEYFSIEDKTDKRIEFEYKQHICPILQDLEKCKIGKMFYTLLSNFKLEFINGKIITSIIDFRNTPEQYFFAELSISSDFIRSDFKNTDYLTSEKIFIDLTNKNICTDPSPDVSRYNSILDWREKMWIPLRFEDYRFHPPEKPFKLAGTNVRILNIKSEAFPLKNDNITININTNISFL